MAGIPILGGGVVSTISWRGIPTASFSGSTGATILFRVPAVPTAASNITYTLSKRIPFGNWQSHTDFTVSGTGNQIAIAVTGLSPKTSYYFRVTASVVVSGQTQTVTSQASNLITTSGTGGTPAGSNHGSTNQNYAPPTPTYQVGGYDQSQDQWGFVGDSLSDMSFRTKDNIETALGAQMKSNSSWFTQSDSLCKRIYTNTLLSGIADKGTTQETPLDSMISGLQAVVQDLVRLITCSRSPTTGQPTGTFTTPDQITNRINTILGPPGASDLIGDLQLLAENLGQQTGDFLVDVWSGVEILFDWLCTTLTCGATGSFTNQQVGVQNQLFSAPFTASGNKPYTNRRLFDFVKGTQKTIDSITGNPLVSGFDSWAKGRGSASLQPAGVGPNIILNAINDLVTGFQAICTVLTGGTLPQNWQASANFQPEQVADTINRVNSVNNLLCANPIVSGFGSILPFDQNSPLNTRQNAGTGGAAFYNGVAGVLSFSENLSKLLGISGPNSGQGQYAPTAAEVQTWIQDTLNFFNPSGANGTLQGVLDVYQNFIECVWQLFVATPYRAAIPTTSPQGIGAQYLYRKTNDLGYNTQYWRWNSITSSWDGQNTPILVSDLGITTQRLQQDLLDQFINPLLGFLNPGGTDLVGGLGDAFLEIKNFVECIANTFIPASQQNQQNLDRSLNWVIAQITTIGSQFNTLVQGGQDILLSSLLGFFQFTVNGLWDILNVLYTFGTEFRLPEPRTGDKTIADLREIFYKWVGTIPVIGPLVQAMTGARVDQVEPETIEELGFLGWGIIQIANFFTGANNGGTLVKAIQDEVNSILQPQRAVLDADGNVSWVPVPAGEWLQQVITKENIEYAIKDLQASAFSSVPVSHLNSAEKTNLLTRGGFVTKSTILNGGGWSCDTGTNLSDYAGGSARHDIISGRSQKLYNNQTVLVKEGDRISMAAQTKTTANYNGDAGSLRMGIVPFVKTATGYSALSEVTLAIRGGTGDLVQTLSNETSALGGQQNVTPYYTVPAGVVAIKAFIMVGTSPTVGTVWWDSVSLWKAGGLEQQNVVKLTGIGGAWSNLWDGLFGTTGSNKTVDDIKPAASSVAQAAGTANANGQTAMVIGQTTINSVDATFGSGTGTNASPQSTLTHFRSFMQRLYAQDTPKNELIQGHIPGLQASKITEGVFTDNFIPNLSAEKITSGQFPEARISDLSAGKITTGTLADGRIPGLQASKIVEGVFTENFIPTLNQSKVSNLSTDLGNRVDYTAYGSFLAGGHNICSNPGFEDAQGYINNGTYVTSSTVPIYSGTRCAALAATGTNRFIELISDKTQALYASAAPGETYYIEFNVRGDNANTATGTANTIGVIMPVYTATGNAAAGTVGLYTNANTVGKNSWVTVTGYVKLPTTSTIAKVRPQIILTGVSAPNIYYFDDIVIREVTESVDIKSKLYDSTSPQNQILTGAVPGLQASKITEGVFDVSFIPVSAVGAGINPTSGSGCVLQRTSETTFNISSATGIFPDTFYGSRVASTDITTSSAGSTWRNKMTVTISGWYLAEIGLKIRQGQGFGWAIAPVLYKGASGATSGSRFRVGSDANSAGVVVGVPVGSSSRYTQSSWIIYLNAGEFIQAGWDATGISDQIIDFDNSGVSNYFSLSLLNRSYA